MVNPHVAYERQKKWLAAHGVPSEADLRTIVYEVPFDRPAEPTNGDTGQNLPQAFPNGATLVLGIQMSCTPIGQPINPYLEALDRFRVLFQYNANQSGLVVGNPSDVGGVASAIVGRYGDQFPAKELRLEANDTILAVVQNITPERIRGTLAYHCLVWKQGQ